MADYDARRRITQNCNMREIGRDRDNLRNVLEDWRHLRARLLTPLRRSLAGDDVPLGKGGFRASAALLRDVRCPVGSRPGTLTSIMGPAIPKN
jgi:hypothetical protein